MSQLGVLAGSACGPVLLGFALSSDHAMLGWIACSVATAIAGVLVFIAGRVHLDAVEASTDEYQLTPDAMETA